MASYTSQTTKSGDTLTLVRAANDAYRVLRRDSTGQFVGIEFESYSHSDAERFMAIFDATGGK